MPPDESEQLRESSHQTVSSATIHPRPQNLAGSLHQDSESAAIASDPKPASEPLQIRDPRRYTLIGEHGRGGLGRVCRTRDRELGRDVAIKEMHSIGAAGEARFLREVLITARLEHPGIVPIYEAGRWPDETPFYAMKLVSGRSLREVIAERRTVHERIALLHHVIAVADAIAYAHSRNIIHRDLKSANIVVGEFGETIVIDWGLAKDLSTPEELGADGTVSPAGDSDLTAAGTVVGTRAYMPPEQERGEQVDYRADVFAIGAMLWELCSLQKVPPDDLRRRHRMLRREGIDPDLVVIIDKALDRRPERRYPNAGALAADLKAFKSGTRISARSYSLLAMIAHWVRRHRTIAVTVALATTLAIVAALSYVRNLGIERERADIALDELTLRHAEQLLTSDPSAAVDVLRDYHGAQIDRSRQIRANAEARGVAFFRATPHTSEVRWVGTAPNGAFISVGIDGAIVETFLDGRSRTLVRDVSAIAMVLESRPRRLLAYTCDPAGLCLFDLANLREIQLPAALLGANINGVAFSPDGALLAVLSLERQLRIIDIRDIDNPFLMLSKSVASNKDIEFIDDNILSVALEDGVEFVSLTGDSERFPLQGLSRWTTDASAHQIAFAVSGGDAIVAESLPVRVVARAKLCTGAITNLQYISGGRGIAYGCRSGSVGRWDLRTNSVHPQAQLESYINYISCSPNGEYIMVAGSTGTMAVIDLMTGIVATYKGPSADRHGWAGLPAIHPLW